MKIKLSENIKNDKGEFKIDSIINIDRKDLEHYKKAGVIREIISEDDLTYEEMKSAELKELAKAKGIEGYDKMKKDGLIAALKFLDENVNPDGKELNDEK